MKKLAFILGVAFVMTLGLSSCKKDYTCDCTYKIGTDSFTYSFEIEDAKKSDAETLCNYTLPGATNVTCDLK